MFSILVLVSGAVLAGTLLMSAGDDPEETDMPIGDDDSEITDFPDVDQSKAPPPINPEIDCPESSDVNDGSCLKISLDEADLEELPSPLSDWITSEEVEQITAGEGDVVDLSLPPSAQGEILVMPADYVEGSASEESNTTITFSGYNVYFVPESDQFPEDYTWSEEGGALFNTSDDLDQDEHFGEIRFLARINTGSFGVEFNEDGEAEILFDAQLGTPFFESPLRVFFYPQDTETDTL